MKNKLIEVLSIQAESGNQFRTFAYIIRQVKAMGCTYYTYNGCIYVTKGKADYYPCMAAHMDTVHDIVENLTVVEIGGNLTGFNSVTMEQTGIGGDDKVGIYIALQCLQTFDNMKAVFFRDEEIGCEGSYDPDHDFFTDCGFVLQCDRKGYGDFITKAGGTKLSDKHFQKDIKGILKDYGYKFESGMMTDVMALKESGILCSMANMSCGYYSPHTAQEYVNINDVRDCLEMVKQIISEIGGNNYTCKYEPRQYVPYTDIKKQAAFYDRYDFVNDLGFWGQSNLTKYPPVKKEQPCDCCMENATLTYVSDYNIEMCDKCINQYIKLTGT
jgi:tripeptide aminopeptidase